jgi:hypothetical protein
MAQLAKLCTCRVACRVSQHSSRQTTALITSPFLLLSNRSVFCRQLPVPLCMSCAPVMPGELLQAAACSAGTRQQKMLYS